MSKAKQLYELQEIDLESDQKVLALKDIEARLGNNNDLVKARSTLDMKRKQLDDLEHQQRTAEWGVDDLATKIAHEEKKLYNGSVKNPRELMSLQQEIDLIKEKRSEQEEKLLVIMIEVDSAQQEVNLRSKELDSMEKDWQKEQQKLSADKTELETNLATLEQKKNLILQQIDPVNVKLYQQLRLAKQGIAVARMVQGRCQGCRISLPMSDQQGARMGHELVTCSNCGRILCVD